MGHSSSAEKRHRQSLKRRARNRQVRTLARSAVRKALDAVGTAPASAESAVLQAVSVLDRAAKKGVLHPGNVARSKSRLLARYNTARAAAAAAPEPAAEAAPKARRAAAKARAGAAKKARAGAAKKARAAKPAQAAKPAKGEKKAPARGLRLGRKKAESK